MKLNVYIKDKFLKENFYNVKRRVSVTDITDCLNKMWVITELSDLGIEGRS